MKQAFWKCSDCYLVQPDTYDAGCDNESCSAPQEKLSPVPQPFRDPIRPPLKWAGGKFNLLPRILPLIDPDKRYIEPFLGGGSVFLNVPNGECLVSDLNEDLIGFYMWLQAEDPTEKIRCWWDILGNDKDTYLSVRQHFNEHRAPQDFYWLNKHCFNGLYRVNKSGQFNVPFGSYKSPGPGFEAAKAMHDRLQADVEILNDPFEDLMDLAAEGDVVYCDPPYVPLSASSDFTSYTKEGFGPKQQERLLCEAWKAHERGADVIISNHDTPITRDLYSGAEIISFDARRSISCKGGGRKPVRELLAIWRQP